MKLGRWVVLACVVGCGPVVDPEGTNSGSGSASESTGDASSDTGVPQPTTDDVADVATGTPIPEPGPDLSGECLVALATVIAPQTPLQWRAKVVHDPATGAVAMELQSLSLDPQSTTTPREPVGDPLPFTTTIAADGTFVVALGVLEIPGEANPITGSDIVADVSIEGVVISPDAWCGVATGMVTAPLMLDLLGSTFAFARFDGALPQPVSSCPI
jgi:hypothetical protein